MAALVGLDPRHMHQRLDIGDMRQGQDGAPVKLLVMRHVARDDRETQVNTAKKCLYLNDFRHVPRALDELVKGTGLGLVQGHAQADLDLVAKRAPIDHRAVGADDASGAQPVEPPGAGCGGEAHPPGQFGGAKMGGVLILAQEAAVGVIEHDIFTS